MHEIESSENVKDHRRIRAEQRREKIKRLLIIPRRGFELTRQLPKRRQDSKTTKKPETSILMCLPNEILQLIVDEVVHDAVEKQEDTLHDLTMFKCKPLELHNVNQFFRKLVQDRFWALRPGDLPPCRVAGAWKCCTFSQLTERQVLERLPFEHGLATDRFDSFDVDDEMLCSCGRGDMFVSGLSLPEEAGLVSDRPAPS